MTTFRQFSGFYSPYSENTEERLNHLLNELVKWRNDNPCHDLTYYRQIVSCWHVLDTLSELSVCYCTDFNEARGELTLLRMEIMRDCEFEIRNFPFRKEQRYECRVIEKINYELEINCHPRFRCKVLADLLLEYPMYGSEGQKRLFFRDLEDYYIQLRRTHPFRSVID